MKRARSKLKRLWCSFVKSEKLLFPEPFSKLFFASRWFFLRMNEMRPHIIPVPTYLQL